jgi:hypothetical protein
MGLNLGETSKFLEADEAKLGTFDFSIAMT